MLGFVVLGVAAIFRAAISQHAAQPHPPRIIERHDAIVDEISRGDGRLAIIELGEGDLGVGVDKAVAAQPPLRVEIVKRPDGSSGFIVLHDAFGARGRRHPKQDRSS